ncbi:hypothetical protein AB5I41_00510 [Sphingomonas sp. MMS24-JH45]
MRGEAGGGAVALAAAGRAVEDLGRLHGPLVPGRGAGDKGRVTLPWPPVAPRRSRAAAALPGVRGDRVRAAPLLPRSPGRRCASSGRRGAAGCQLPFEHDAGEERRCDACRERPPRHAGVRAAVGYGPGPRALALQLKYGRRTGHAATAAKLMRRHLPRWMPSCWCRCRCTAGACGRAGTIRPG